jgi:hypothetical protein
LTQKAGFLLIAARPITPWKEVLLMAGYRFWLQSSLSVVLALTIVHAGRSQTNVPPAVFENGVLQVSETVSLNGSTCKVYSLRDLGDDPNLCQWIAETIPDVIQPGSWKQDGVKLSYYAPSKILVVNHTSAVHVQVDQFLQNLKKSLPPQNVKANRDTRDSGVVPTQFALKDPPRPVGPVQTNPASYPVPFPPQAPKHLFHFIIRYEGDGIIDSSVVKFAKALSNASSISTTRDVGPPSLVCPAPMPMPHYLSQPAQYGVPTLPATNKPGSTRGSAPVMPPADSAPAHLPPSAPPPQPSSSSAPVSAPTARPPAPPALEPAPPTLPPNVPAPTQTRVPPYAPPPPPPVAVP